MVPKQLDSHRPEKEPWPKLQAYTKINSKLLTDLNVVQ